MTGKIEEEEKKEEKLKEKIEEKEKERWKIIFGAKNKCERKKIITAIIRGIIAAQTVPLPVGQKLCPSKTRTQQPSRQPSRKRKCEANA